MRAVACLLIAALACAAGGARAGARPAWAGEGRSATIAVTEASGETVPMVVTWFLPRDAAAGPVPVVVFSHGRDVSAGVRAQLAVGVSRAQLLFWLARGVAVVAPVRPGYGASGGADIEEDHIRVDPSGHCIGHAEFRHTADAAARAIDATLQWLQTQTWADAHEVMLAGQSVGGLATVAAGAGAAPGVVGYVNFAGGSGGNARRSPGLSCDPDQLEALYADYGRATTVPNLWVYALDDEFWGARSPRDWHAAFARGGSPSTFVQEPAVADGRGHALSSHDFALWAPAVDAFLAQLGPPWNAATLPRPTLRLDAGGF